ncbi:MAG TPA: RNA polymerase sigma factor [Polyangiales bacterium]
MNSGSRSDFDDVYRRHAPNAFRRARRLLGNEADAHEVVHDLFLAFFEHPEQYAGRSSMSTFLYSAVTHACLNQLRNRNNRLRLLRESAAALPALDHRSPRPERMLALRSALERMPGPLAQVAVYYYFDELTHEDISRIVGCSRRHVGDLLQRLTQWVDTHTQEQTTCKS